MKEKANYYEAARGDEKPFPCPGCGEIYTPAHSDQVKRDSWQNLAWTAEARRGGAYGGAFGGSSEEGYVEHRVCACDVELTVKIWTKGVPT